MSVRETVRVGIFGPSWWVDYWHLPAIRSQPNAVITGVCGISPRDEQEIKGKIRSRGALFYRCGQNA